jgi:N-methylhydantoinase B
LKCILGPELPTNCGFFRPVKIVAPPGSVLNPLFPAAVAGRAPLWFRVFDVIYRALADALPGRVPVIGEGGDALHLSGRRDDGSEFSFLDLYFGGWGARPHEDGIDGVAPVFMGSYGSASIELLEAENPVVFDGFGFVPDSEGPGRHRGSLAIWRQWRFLTDAHAMVRTGRLEPAPGLADGLSGASARSLLLRDGKESELPLRTHIHLDVRRGDAIYHSTAGAGGYGEPFGRDAALVAADVEAGILTPGAAARRYGVAVSSDGVVDLKATQALRAARTQGSVGGRRSA